MADDEKCEDENRKRLGSHRVRGSSSRGRRKAGVDDGLVGVWMENTETRSVDGKEEGAKMKTCLGIKVARPWGTGGGRTSNGPTSRC